MARKCRVCNQLLDQLSDVVTCSKCHTTYDFANRKTDRTNTAIEPMYCNHRKRHNVCGGMGSDERYNVSICDDCGEFTVWTTKNGQSCHITFTLNTPESVIAAGKFARLDDDF